MPFCIATTIQLPLTLVMQYLHAVPAHSSITRSCTPSTLTLPPSASKREGKMQCRGPICHLTPRPVPSRHASPHPFTSLHASHHPSTSRLTPFLHFTPPALIPRHASHASTLTLQCHPRCTHRRWHPAACSSTTHPARTSCLHEPATCIRGISVSPRHARSLPT